MKLEVDFAQKYNPLTHFNSIRDVKPSCMVRQKQIELEKQSKELADKVPGATYTLMEGMGHFPMSEDPAKFKKYIIPVLSDIEEKSERAPLAASGG